jgi:hypothetical protein
VSNQLDKLPEALKKTGLFQQHMKIPIPSLWVQSSSYQLGLLTSWNIFRQERTFLVKQMLSDIPEQDIEEYVSKISIVRIF